LLGLGGEVDLDECRADFATDGAHHPETFERLVACMRPRVELVISPHKSVAELGVLGKAEDMHAILDAEREATMAYLNEVVREQGGRRGRAQVRTPTGGAHLGGVPACDDPFWRSPAPRPPVGCRFSVHAGRQGDWKALDTALLGDHLHAVTAIGRMAAAAKAVELGYGIEPDHGLSGRLGSWVLPPSPAELLQARTYPAMVKLNERERGPYRRVAKC
jgi:hypothetical protein